MDNWGPWARWFRRNRESHKTDYHLIQHPALVDCLGDIAGKKALDVGCGPGTLAIAMTQKGARVTAVDASEAMLAVAREEAKARGVSVDFVRSPLAECRQWDRCFDLVAAVNVLRYLEEPADLLQLVDRGLADAGRFVLSDVHPLIDAADRSGGLEERRVSDYFGRRRDTMEFSVGPAKAVVPFYRRPLEDIFAALADAGFAVNRFAEPRPRADLVTLSNRKYFEAGNRFPFCYVLEAVRR